MFPSVEELSKWNSHFSCEEQIVSELVLHRRSNIVFTSLAFIIRFIESAGGATMGSAVTGRGAGVDISISVFSTGCMDISVGFKLELQLV